MRLLPDKNFEVYLFAGDPNKGQAPWMYSLRYGKYSVRGKGGESVHRCLQEAADHIARLQNQEIEDYVPYLNA